MSTSLRSCIAGGAMAVLVTAAGSAIAAPAPASTRAPAAVRCSFAAIDHVVLQSLTHEGSKAWLLKKDVKCSGSWAVAFPDVGANKAHANTVTVVLKKSGGVWLLKSRTGKTCKSPGHEVPAPIFKLACLSN
jgi:hypothetical protein